MGARYSTPVQNDPGAYPASYTMGMGSFPGAKRPGCGIDHPPHLAQILKKEYSYTSTPLMGLRGLFQGDLYLYLYTSYHNSYTKTIIHPPKQNTLFYFYKYVCKGADRSDKKTRKKA